MEDLIGILPPEVQDSCKRGRANRLKLVEEFISSVLLNPQLSSIPQFIDLNRIVSTSRLMKDNSQYRSKADRLVVQLEQSLTDKDRLTVENDRLLAENDRLRRAANQM